MPKLLTSKADHRARAEIWAQRVSNINGIEWPESFGAKDNVSNKYTRFTGYVKEWMHGILSSSEGKKNDIHPSERFEDARLGEGLGEDWWKLAMKRSSGKIIEEGLPGASFYGAEKKNEVYDRFMPAYKAIKESFDNRRWYEWIFNHAQYTAERDALKAIKGMIMELTMDGTAEFENAYNVYTETVALNDEIAQNEGEVNNKNKISIGAEMKNDLNKAVVKRPVESFADLLANKLNDPMSKHVTAVSVGINKILQEYGNMERTDLIRAIEAADFQQIAQDLNRKVDSNTDIAEKHRIMDKGAKNLFKKVYACVLENLMQDNDKRIVAAQKITDLMLRVYSPAGFDKAEFGKYANNYIVSQNDEFTKQDCFLDINPTIIGMEDLEENIEKARNELGASKELLHIESSNEYTDIQNQIISEEDDELNISRSSLNSSF